MQRRNFLTMAAGLPLSLQAWAAGESTAAAPTPAIRLNQTGYLPGAAKQAMIVGAKTRDFHLRNVTGQVVWRGHLSQSRQDDYSGDLLQTADFSAWQTAGKYVLEVPGLGRSWEFAIDSRVYDRAWYLTMRAYYGQRCGCEVDLGPEFSAYRHPPCHLLTAYHPSAGRSGAPHNLGGWHDAGDYGRYIVNAAVATATLLWAYELYGERLEARKLDLPALAPQDADLPDMLREIRWNLDWMLTLQDHDGGVWHKQSSTHFCAFIMPQDDHLPSEIIGTGTPPYKNTAATADLAAAAAIAARVYRPYDAAYAAQCLDQAERAWAWALRHPHVPFHNPPGVSTGEYGDQQLADELLWAAAELWRTTRKRAYLQYFLAHVEPFLRPPSAHPRTRRSIPDGGHFDWRTFVPPPTGISDHTPLSWGSVGPLALWSFALSQPASGAEDAVARRIISQTMASADAIAARTLKNGYRVALRAQDYVWGSNGVAGNYALQLLIALRLDTMNAWAPARRGARQQAWITAAGDQLHYLLGRNTFSLSWVTQLGAHAFRHPHHRPSVADHLPLPWPGLLSGGPNAHPGDPRARQVPPGPPARMYVDAWPAYSMNEVAINWNAPLVFLLSGPLQD